MVNVSTKCLSGIQKYNPSGGLRALPQKQTKTAKISRQYPWILTAKWSAAIISKLTLVALIRADFHQTMHVLIQRQQAWKDEQKHLFMHLFFVHFAQKCIATLSKDWTKIQYEQDMIILLSLKSDKSTASPLGPMPMLADWWDGMSTCCTDCPTFVSASNGTVLWYCSALCSYRLAMDGCTMHCTALSQYTCWPAGMSEYIVSQSQWYISYTGHSVSLMQWPEYSMPTSCHFRHYKA